MYIASLVKSHFKINGQLLPLIAIDQIVFKIESSRGSTVTRISFPAFFYSLAHFSKPINFRVSSINILPLSVAIAFGVNHPGNKFTRNFFYPMSCPAPQVFLPYVVDLSPRLRMALVSTVLVLSSPGLMFLLLFS